MCSRTHGRPFSLDCRRGFARLKLIVQLFSKGIDDRLIHFLFQLLPLNDLIYQLQCRLTVLAWSSGRYCSIKEKILNVSAGALVSRAARDAASRWTALETSVSSLRVVLRFSARAALTSWTAPLVSSRFRDRPSGSNAFQPFSVRPHLSTDF